MAGRVRRNQELRPSLLERLSDEAASERRPYRMADYMESVRRDLENLLNTRWRVSVWPPDLDQIDDSVVNYGIPDFTGANLGSPDEQETFRDVVERVLQRFEPRFKRVRVEFVKAPNSIDRTLRFRIQATLWADPVPIDIAFDSSLEPLTSTFHVSGGGK